MIRGSSTRWDRMNDSFIHRVIGRSSAKVRDRLKNSPTDTGSRCSGPSVARWACTTSKIGRSNGGPSAAK